MKSRGVPLTAMYQPSNPWGVIHGGGSWMRAHGGGLPAGCVNDGGGHGEPAPDTGGLCQGLDGIVIVCSRGAWTTAKKRRLQKRARLPISRKLVRLQPSFIPGLAA